MKAPNELSFLPDDYLDRKARRRANALCAGVSVLVMGAIATAFWVTERTMREVEGRAAAVDRAYTEAAKSIEQVKRMKEQHEKVVHHAELVSSLVEKVPRSNLLAEFTNSLPPGTSLLELAMESRQKVVATGAAAPTAAQRSKKKPAAPAGAATAAPPALPAQPDVYIKLTGVADTDVQVAEFMTKLTGCELLKDVNLVISDVLKQGDRTMRRFQIEMTLNPAAEVKDEPAANQTTAAVELTDEKK
jgi:Tfp pilus assembly protein PilN